MAERRGQSQYVRVAFADVGPSKIPDWMSDEDAVLCTDALARLTDHLGAEVAIDAVGARPTATLSLAGRLPITEIVPPLRTESIAAHRR